MTRAAFPDAPLTGEETRKVALGEPIAMERQAYYFDDRIVRTERVVVMAHDEDEAWRIYHDPSSKHRRALLLDEEEIDETRLRKPGQWNYPASERHP